MSYFTNTLTIIKNTAKSQLKLTTQALTAQSQLTSQAIRNADLPGKVKATRYRAGTVIINLGSKLSGTRQITQQGA